MRYQSSQKLFHAAGPLANVLVVLAGCVVIAVSVMLGVVALVFFGGLFVILAAVFSLKLWWMRRSARHGADPHVGSDARGGDGGSGQTIEGEYRVVHDRKPQDS